VSAQRERLITIKEKTELTQYIQTKPYLRVLIPAIIGSVTEFTFVAAIGSLALKQATVTEGEFNDLLNRTRDDINGRLNAIATRIWYEGVNIVQGQYAVLNVYIQRADGRVTWASLKNYTFDPYPDVEWVKQNYAQSAEIAKSRWQEYVATLTAEEADAILDAAVSGYKQFMSGGQSKHVLAALKHAMRLGTVDRQIYVQKLQEAVQRYRLDSEKYGEIMGVVLRALDATVKLIVDFAKHR